jgi:hypothetical protein
MNHKLVNDMEMWKGKGNTIILFFSFKELKMLHKERREYNPLYKMQQPHEVEIMKATTTDHMLNIIQNNNNSLYKTLQPH